MAFLAVAPSGRSRWIALIAAVVLQSLFLVPAARLAHAQASDAPRELKRPDYQVRRFDEDWSVLKGVDVTKTDDWWDRLKFISLSPDQSVWLSLGGQVRERAEYYRQFFFGASDPKQTDAYLLSRIRLSADLHVTPFVRMFVEAKSSFALDRELTGSRTNAYVDEFDLQNGFADINIPIADGASVTLRGGREELLFGAQRLVGPSDFTNVRRTFDGASGIVKLGDWTITPFWAELVIVNKYRFNESTPDNKLFGVYSTGRLPGVPVNLDLYWLDADNAVAAFNGTAGREQRHTLGGRVWGKIGATGLDFETEAAGQFGTVGHEDISAGMFTAVLGYTLPITPLSPRVYAEFDYASGDRRPGGTVGTFNQLYPTAHSFLGYIDYIGRQNIISPNGGVAVKPLHDLTLSLQQYFFWRASDRDAIYNKSGAVIRPGTTTDARYVGAEVDLYATYNLTRHVLGYAGYAHFFPGDFIRKTGPHSDSDFLYAAIQYTF